MAFYASAEGETVSTFYQAFLDHTQTLPALVALVGTRVHSVKYPQSPLYPAIRVSRSGQPDRDYTHDGDSGIIVSRYLIEVSDSEQTAVDNDPLTSALAVANLLSAKPVDSGFSGFKGLLGVAPNQLLIGGMWLQSQFEIYDPDELRVLRVVQDWRVQHCPEN